MLLGHTFLGKEAGLPVQKGSWKEEGKHSSLFHCAYINAQVLL